MSDGERRKKIEAGRQMLAQMTSKKKKTKINLSSQISQQSQNDSNTVDPILQTNIESMKSTGDHWKNPFSSAPKKVVIGMEAASSMIYNDHVELDTFSDKFFSQTEDQSVHLVSECSHKIKKYQEALLERDSYINLLTNRLESTFKTQYSVQEEGVSQTQILTKDMYELQQQMQQVKEVLEKQKRKSVLSSEVLHSSIENVNFKNESILTESKEQVTSMHNEIRHSNQTKTTTVGDNVLDNQVHSSECVLGTSIVTQVSEGEIFENEEDLLMKQLQDSVNVNERQQAMPTSLEKCTKDLCVEKRHKDITCPNDVNPVIDNIEKSPRKILKRLGYLNIIAEMIESLLNLVKHTGTKSVDLSNAQIVDFNYSNLDDSVKSDNGEQLVMSSCVSTEFYDSKHISSFEHEIKSSSSSCDDTSVEVMRKMNVSEKLSYMREFFLEEMINCCAEMQLPGRDLVSKSMISNTNKSPDNLSHELQNVQVTHLPSADAFYGSVSNKETQDIYESIILLKEKLENKVHHFKLLESSLKQMDVKNPADLDDDDIRNSKDLLLEKEKPLLSISFDSFTDDVSRENQVKVTVCENVVPDDNDKLKNILCIHERDHDLNMMNKDNIDMNMHLSEYKLDVESGLCEQDIFIMQRLCTDCKINIPCIIEKFNKKLMSIQEHSKNICNIEKNELVQKISVLEVEITELSDSKKFLEEKLEEQNKICSSYIADIAEITRQYKELICVKSNLEKQSILKESEMLSKIKELQECIIITNEKAAKYLEEKADIEYTLQNQIADLIQEHEQDINSLKKDSMTMLMEEKSKIEDSYIAVYDELKKEHQEKEKEMQFNLQKSYEEEKCKLVNQHARNFSQMEAEYSKKINILQKKEEALLEEKCLLHSKHKEELDITIKNHCNVLNDLALSLQSQIAEEQKIMSLKSLINSPQNSCFSDAFNILSNKLCHDINIHLNQNVSGSGTRSKLEDNFFTSNQTPLHRVPYSEAGNFEARIEELRTEVNNFKAAHEEEIQSLKKKHAAALEDAEKSASENFLLSEKVQCLMMEEANKLKEDFEKEMEKHKTVNDVMTEEIKLLKNRISKLGETRSNSKYLTKTADKAQDTSDFNETKFSDSSAGHAAQTNSRLLHVLSDLVKTFLDIERDINSHLVAYGVIGKSMMDTMAQHDDDTGQSVGSREDFTALSVSESPNLELSEDGLDLTPRAWDQFTSLGAYDADAEGEDVIIGASRRLRAAVDNVLRLLSCALENQHSQDVKNLLKHNEELSNDLQEESRHTNSLQMDLVISKNLIRKLETEKRELEDLNLNLKKNEQCLADELILKKEQLKFYEDEKYNENRQCLMTLDGALEEVFEDDTNLTLTKNISDNISKERHSLATKVHNLELSLDEISAQKDEMIEKKQQEIEDLKGQMESMEKQLLSNRKFIEEQAQEREQEREEFLWQLKELKDIVREKEKIQECEEQLTKEVSNLEQLLKMKMEDNMSIISKKEELENELGQSFDKIRDLRDVIGELESQLELRTNSETELKQQLVEMLQSLSVHETEDNLKKGYFEKPYSPVNQESAEHMQDLEEQLASRTQEVEQLTQSHILLQELRGQIHFLEAKVEQRIRQLESMYLSSLSTSPVLSDDASHSESQDGDFLHTTVEDGWAMSPRSLHWLEIRRLEEKIGRLAHIEEELVKRNKDLESHVRKIKISEEEHDHEKAALQEQVTSQLLQISALKSSIEEQRHKIATPLHADIITELEELKGQLVTEQELKKVAESNLLNIKECMKEMKNKITEKDETINKLYDAQSERRKETNSQKLSISTQTMQVSDIADETIRYCIPSCFQLLLKDKNEQIDILNGQLQTLQTQLDEARKGNPNSLLMVSPSICDPKVEKECNEADISLLQKKILDLTNTVDHLEGNILALKDDIGKSTSRVNELEDMLQDANRQLDVERSHVQTLLEETCLEEDFNTVQDMMLRKEKELATLHEETEIQMKLEAEMDTLRQLLTVQKLAEKELKQKINELQKNLEDTNRNHMDKMEQWFLNLEEITEKFESEQEILKEQIHILRQNMSPPSDDEEIDIKLVWHAIIDASEALSTHLDVKETFHQLVLHILQIFAASAAKVEQKKLKLDIENVQKSWQIKFQNLNKLHETTLEEVTACKNQCEQHEIEKVQLENYYIKLLEESQNIMEKKLKEEMSKAQDEQDKFWQEKLNEIECTLEAEFENKKKLFLLETQEGMFKNMENFKKSLQEHHMKEMVELKQNLDAAVKEKDDLSFIHKKELDDMLLTLKSKEKEKSDLIKELEAKFVYLEEKSHSELDERKKIEESYHSKMLELQTILSAKMVEKEQMQAKHREEMDMLHNLFKNRWSEQVMKLHQLHQEELKKAIECKDESIKEIGNHLLTAYQEKLQEIQNECEQQIALERKQINISHQKEIQQLQQLLEEKFHVQKQKIMEVSEEQLQILKQELENKYSQELSEVHDSHNIQSYSQLNNIEDECRKKWENERHKIESEHQREINSLKENFQISLDNQHESLLKTHQEEMKQLEQVYVQELKLGINMIQGHLDCKGSIFKDADHGSSPSGTYTPSSEVSTSSDNTSCSIRNAVPPQLQTIMDKMNKDGLEVLSLSQMTTIEHVFLPLLEDINLWKKEKQWIVHILRSVTKVDEKTDLKFLIDELVQELKLSREKIAKFHSKEQISWDHIVRLENQLSILREFLFRVQREHISQDIYAVGLTNENSTKAELLEKLKQESKMNTVVSLADSSNVELGNILDVNVSHRETETDIDSNKKVQICSNCTATKNLIPAERQRWIHEKSALQRVIQDAQEEISEYRCQLHKLVHQKNGSQKISLDSKIHYLFCMYKRSESLRKALNYQKKYLLFLLSGYQATEKVTLAVINRMNCFITKKFDLHSSSDSCLTDQSIKGRSLFRSISYVIIAVNRMKFILRNRQMLLNVPPSHIILQRIEALIKRSSSTVPILITGPQNALLHTSSSTLSHSPSIDEFLSNIPSRRQSSTSIREDIGTLPSLRNESISGRGQLIEYVSRLESLHEQLGLHSVDKS